MENLKIIETDRLFIREMTVDDTTHLYNLSSNKKVMKYLKVLEPSPPSEEKIRNIIKMAQLQLWFRFVHG